MIRRYLTRHTNRALADFARHCDDALDLFDFDDDTSEPYQPTDETFTAADVVTAWAMGVAL